MMRVIKRRGKLEPYKPSKIRASLEKATIDAGYSLDEKKEIIDKIYETVTRKLEGKEEIKTDTIRMCLLTELDKCEPYIARSWRRFEKKYKS
ncbi:MAG TPA: transcriptional regulator [Methanobacteriales archaeon]|nr:transcriptional regulator [Methanobacteriales archaeon]